MSPAHASAAPPAGDATPGAPPPLPELLLRALARDPQVQVARSVYGIAHERLRQAQSRMWPVAGLSATYGESVDVEFGRAEFDRRTERAEASLRWNALNGGRDRREIDAAEIELDAALLGLRQAQEEVSERLAGAYLDLLRQELLLPYSLARLEAVRELTARARRQAELGRIADADARQADAALADAELVHAQVEADLEAARRQLSVLAGEPVAAATAAGLPMLTGRPATLFDHDAVPASLRAERLRASAARERVQTLAQALSPRLDLETRYRMHDRTTPAATTETRSGWTVGLRWEFPLGGELIARRNETAHRADALAAETQRLEQLVRAEQALLEPRIDNAERSLAMLARQIEQYARLIRAGELQFEAGRRGVIQLIQLHDARFAAEARRGQEARRLAGDRLRQLALGGELLEALGVPAVEPPPTAPLIPPPAQ
ncbi:MAG: TolC family protein [Burkholderiales bacterium]|nr:TolC family protein [Burkholderiales bacterium]